MRRNLLAAAVVALLAVAAAPARAADQGASFTRSSYTNAAGTRQYMLYLPPHWHAPMALVVYLHGCTQTADDAALGSRWNQLAAKEHIAVVYPEQDPAANGTKCWNWFEPQHQSRDAGEPSIIAGITRLVMQTQRINPKRVFVMGVSAGADMATIMGATYPDLYAAIAPAAGCAYLTCADVSGAAAYAAMGSHAREVPAFIDQGTADMLNNFALGETAERQWVGTNDFADNGQPDGSVRLTSSESHDLSPTLQPGTGDPCVRNSNFPCLGGAVGLQGGYPYTVNHYTDANGCGVVDFFIVHGLNHAYAGGDPNGTFVDPLGPDLTRAAWSFFQAHPMGACAR